MPEIRQDIRAATLVVAADDSLHKNMADYVCDGVADDVEINAAIEATTVGGVVMLLEGHFIISAPIRITKPCRLVGQGWGTHPAQRNGTIISLANNADCNAIEYVLTAEAEDVSLTDLALNGNKANQGVAGDGIHIANAHALYSTRIRHVKCEDFKGHGIYAAPTATLSDLRIQESVTQFCDLDGIHLIPGVGGSLGMLWIDKHYCRSNREGIYIEGEVYDFSLTSLFITSSEHNGLHLVNVGQGAEAARIRNRIIGAAIRYNSREGDYLYDDVLLESVVGLNMSDVQIGWLNDGTKYGLRLVESNYNIFGNLQIWRKQMGAIYLDMSSYNNFNGGMLKDNCRRTNNTYDVITLTDDGATYSTYNKFGGLTIVEVAANKARYGFRENAVGDDYNTYLGNTVLGAVTGAFSLLGVNDEQGHNV